MYSLLHKKCKLPDFKRLFYRSNFSRICANSPNYYSRVSSSFSSDDLHVVSTEVEREINVLQRLFSSRHYRHLNPEILHNLTLIQNEFIRHFAQSQQKPEDKGKNKLNDKNGVNGAGPPGGGNGMGPSPNGTGGGGDDENLSSLLVKAVLWMLGAYMFIAFISLAFPGSNQTEVVRYVSWNEFVHQMLAKGEVEELIVRPDINLVTIILYDGAVIKGKRVDYKTYHMNIVDMPKFEEKLRLAEERILGSTGDREKDSRELRRIPIVYERSTDSAGKLLASLIIGGIILFGILSRPNNASKIFKGGPGGFMNLDSFTQMGRAKFTLVDTSKATSTGKGVRFSDVAGLKEAKIEVMEFVDYLKKPEIYRNLGAKVPRGALLLGPPGCGKTMLAKAVATEAGVPFLSMNGSEFIEMIGGLGAARVRDLFKEAKSRSPCIIYIDEIDAIGRIRSGGGGGSGAGESGGGGGSAGESEQTLNQLLVEMDGMSSKEGVLVLSSTNRADVLDKALLRPGRFDRHILIDLPNVEERKEIFEQHLKGIKLERKPDKYSRRLAELTPGFSGADIANVCNEAALHGARFKKKVVGGLDLEYAVERSVGGTEKRTQVMSLDERKFVAYHEAGRAIVSWMMETTSDTLLKITIVPRTSMRKNLGFSSFLPSDKKLYTQQELFERMCLFLGGRIAETLTFNRVSISGKSEVDLERVTKMAYAQIRQYGMSEKVGLLSFPEEADDGGIGTKKPYGKNLGNLIDEEVRRLVARAYTHTEGILKANKEKLEKLADELLKKESLNYEEVVAIIGPSPFAGGANSKRLKSFKLEEEDILDTVESPSSPPSDSEPKLV